MANKLLFSEDARQAMLRGASKIATAVKSTLGPAGRTVVIEKPFGAPSVTKDGVTVAKTINLEDHYENMGAQLIKEAASKTNEKAGDGTSTGSVLAEAIFREGLKYVTSGCNPVQLQRGIMEAAEAIVERIKEQAVPVDDRDTIKQIATVSANWDEEIGNLIADAMEAVGKDGVITVEESRSTETSMEVVTGMQIEKGYLSPYFMTDAATTKAVMDDALVFVIEDKISNVRSIVNLLNDIARENKPALIIADDIEGEALAALVVNKMRGVLNVAAIKSPGFGDRRKAMLEDIAVATGASFIAKDLGTRLEDVSIVHAGRAKRIVVTKDETVITEGAGDPEKMKARAEQIKHQLSETTSEYDKDKLTERLAKLSGGVAVLKIGAATESELKEKKDRVDDALHATRAAVEEGIVPGGGVTLLKAADAVLADVTSATRYKEGYDIVCKAATYPLRAIAENAGDDGGVVIANVRRGESLVEELKFHAEDQVGYDALTGKLVYMIGAGIIDPAKVTRCAVQHAASVAGLMLTTECMIADIKESSSVGMPTTPSNEMTFPL